MWTPVNPSSNSNKPKTTNSFKKTKKFNKSIRWLYNNRRYPWVKIKSQFYDLLEILKKYKNYIKKKKKLIFLGDYVDRGPHSIETITLLFLLKLKNPENIYLLRGNHETRKLTQNYGFFMECQFKYKKIIVWSIFIKTFNYLSIALLCNNKVLCLHGGLSPNFKFLDDLNNINSFF